MSDRWILGFDVGGTKTAAVAGTPEGEILSREAFPSRPERGFRAMWDDMVRAAERITGGRGEPISIGVSIGGPLDSERGVIYSPPNLPGWDEVPLKAMLEERFGVPAEVEHDAKACALAEWMFGAARGARNVVFLTFGTGLGAGLILDGRLYRGTTDNAGEVGHWRIAEDGPLVYGKRGSWEGYSSGTGIAALAARYLTPGRFPDDVTAADVIAAARDRNADAQEILRVSAGKLGLGIALLLDLLNPEVVVLGSLAVRAGDLILPLVEETVRREALSHTYAACRIVPAALGDRIGDVAALCPPIYRSRLIPDMPPPADP